jgi:hypothetical protein
MNLYIHEILNLFRNDPRVKFVDLSKDLNIQRKVLYDYCEEKTRPDFTREKGMIYFFKELYDTKENELKINSYYKDKEKTNLKKELVRDVIKDGISQMKKVKLPEEINEGMLFIFHPIGKERASAKQSNIYEHRVGDYQLTIKNDDDDDKYIMEIENVDGGNMENKKILVINGLNEFEINKSEDRKAWKIIDKSKIDHSEKFYVNIKDAK